MGNTNWPDRTCSGKLSNWTLQNYFNQSCFPTAPQYTFGNAGRNVLYGPGINNVDFAVHRFFPIPFRERMKLEFRAELFNFFNRPEFAIPAVTLNPPTTGTITSTNTNIPKPRGPVRVEVAVVGEAMGNPCNAEPVPGD